jgi:hypothetical protein
MFWSEIDINNNDDVRLFDAWPLIPLKHSELMSCSLMECGLVTEDSEEGGLRKVAALEEQRLLAGGEEVGERGEEEEEEEEEDVEAEISF